MANASIKIDALLDWKKLADSAKDTKTQRHVKKLVTEMAHMVEAAQRQQGGAAAVSGGMMGNILFGKQGAAGLQRQLGALPRQLIAGMRSIPIIGPMLAGGAQGVAGLFSGAQWRRGGLMGQVAGVGGGLAGGAAAIGISGLLMSIFRGYGMERAQLGAAGSLGQFRRGGGIMGGPGEARRLSLSGRQLGMSAEEMLQLGVGTARATGSAAATGIVGATQRMYGAGSEAIGLLGAAARHGGMQGTEAEREGAAMKILGDVIGGSVAAGLDKSRVGEAMVGTAQILEGQALGLRTDKRGIGLLHGIIGTGEVDFQGAGGFKVMQALDRMAKGGVSGFGKVASLIALGGLGRGSNYFEALRRSEGGIFGGGEGQTLERVKAIRGQYKRMAPNKDVMEFAMSQQMGLPMTTVAKLNSILDDLESGKTDQGEATKKMEAIMKESQPLERKAAQSVVDNFPTVKNIEVIMNQLANIGQMLITNLAPKLLLFIEGMLSWLEQPAQHGAVTKEARQAANKVEAALRAGRSPAAEDVARLEAEKPGLGSSLLALASGYTLGNMAQAEAKEKKIQDIQATVEQAQRVVQQTLSMVEPSERSKVEDIVRRRGLGKGWTRTQTEASVAQEIGAAARGGELHVPLEASGYTVVVSLRPNAVAKIRNTSMTPLTVPPAPTVGPPTPTPRK